MGRVNRLWRMVPDGRIMRGFDSGVFLFGSPGRDGWIPRPVSFVGFGDPGDSEGHCKRIREFPDAQVDKIRDDTRRLRVVQAAVVPEPAAACALRNPRGFPRPATNTPAPVALAESPISSDSPGPCMAPV